MSGKIFVKGETSQSVNSGLTQAGGLTEVSEKAIFFRGSHADDIVQTGAGNDLVLGRKGDDLIDAGEGHDKVIGGWGQDTLNGEDGNDRLWGGRGEDMVDGGAGADRLGGGRGDDTLIGGAGDDRLFGGRDDDTAKYDGSILDYTWLDQNGPWMEVEDTAGDSGTDKLHSVENLAFDDYLLDLDGDNAALVKADGDTASEDTGGSFVVSAWDFDGGTPVVDSFSVTGGGSLNMVSQSPNDETPMAEGVDFLFQFDPGDAYQYLAEGESVTETATIVVVDGQGMTTTYEHVFTIVGENDAPVVVESATEVEILADDDTGEATGAIEAFDIDTSDVLGYAVENGGQGTYGTLSVDDAGEWTYTLNEGSAALDALAAGEEAVETFKIAVMDDKGGEDFYELSVSVIGAEDPSITLDFEDLEVELGALAPVPEGYMGFDWSNAGYFLESDEFRGGEGTPYQLAATSGDNIVYNQGTEDLVISRDESFELVSANLTSSSRPEMEVTATGFLDGVETGSQTFTISSLEVTEAEFDQDIFGEVDQVAFDSEFDVLGRFLLDDLEYVA